MTLILKILLYLLFFFIGIEYVLILPSLNGYLEILNVGSSWIGICIGALNFAALVTNVPCGILVDYTGNVRLVSTALALCCGLGNILYVCIPKIEAVVSSRVFSGIGSSMEPILFGILGRVTSPKERSAVIAQHMLARELGLIFGPILNMGFDKVSYQVTDTIILNKFTMPAAFLAISWLLLSIMLLVFYEENNENPKSSSNSIESNVDSDKPIVHNEEDGFEPIDNPVNSKLLQSKSEIPKISVSRLTLENPFTSLTNSQFNIGPTLKEPEPEATGGTLIVSNIYQKPDSWKYLLSDAFVVVMMSSFSVMFFESSLETVLTPLTQKFFNWGAVENSICYIAIGIAALTGYFVLMLVQKLLKTEDRTLLLTGCVGVTLSMSTAIFTWPLGYYGASWLLPVFAAQIGLGVFFLPFLLVPPATLLSKISSPERQSTLQSARMSFQKTAMVLGPLWGSHTLFNLYYCISAPLFMVALVTVLTAFSYTYLTDDKIQYKPKTYM